MLYRNASIFAFACVLTVAGCRDNGTLTPADLSMAGGGGGGTGGGDMAVTTKTYTTSTIAAMRMMSAPGNFEWDNVVVIAKTSSSSSPHLVVQDAAGGDYSAMYTTCSATSTTHPCAATSDNKTAAVGDKLTIKGTFVRSSNANGQTETFYIDSITNNGPAGGSPPTPVPVTLADIARNNGVAVKKWWFQKVVVTPAPAANALVMYDFIPKELAFTGGTGCPKQVGWGMAPSGTAGAATTLSCPTPTMSATPDPAEVLIGTEFYKQFTDSSDCACAKTDMGAGSPLVTSTTATTGAISGILLYDSVFMSSPVETFQYISPTSLADLPLSNTM